MPNGVVQFTINVLNMNLVVFTDIVRNASICSNLKLFFFLSGLCYIVLAPDTALPIIGAILGAALAAGNGLICQIDSNMRPLARLLLELSKNAGYM